MADKLNVMAICGSLRKGSFNRMLMNATISLAPEGMAIKEGPPWASIPIYNFDDQQAGFPAIVSPEYNWSVPGGLKNAVDWVSRMKEQPFKDKPVAVQSAAGGLLGGARAQLAWRQSLTSVDVAWFGRPEVIINFAAQKFDEGGKLKDQTASDMIKAQLAAFETFIRLVTGTK